MNNANSTKRNRCPVYKKCGGCQLDTAYPDQLRFKQGKTERLLRRFGRVEPIIGMENPSHYRNKSTPAISRTRLPTRSSSASDGCCPPSG